MIYGLFMAQCGVADEDDAADFRYAMDTPIRADGSRGYLLKELADACGVSITLVKKWRDEGNVPARHVTHLPDDVWRLYREQQARRAGAAVVGRDMVKDIGEFLFSVLRPVAVKASLGSMNEPWNGAERRKALVA